jgi:hypothetical protein
MMLRWQIYAWAKQPEMPSHERSAGRDSRRLQNGGVLRQAQSDASDIISKAEKPAEATAAAVRKVLGRPSRRRPPAIVHWQRRRETGLRPSVSVPL